MQAGSISVQYRHCTGQYVAVCSAVVEGTSSINTTHGVRLFVAAVTISTAARQAVEDQIRQGS